MQGKTRRASSQFHVMKVRLHRFRSHDLGHLPMVSAPPRIELLGMAFLALRGAGITIRPALDGKHAGKRVGIKKAWDGRGRLDGVLGKPMFWRAAGQTPAQRAEQKNHCQCHQFVPQPSATS